MGMFRRQFYPIPTPTLPLKGRESFTEGEKY
jgi:hypothetical protein